MHLLLTKFHMYLENIILQVINTKHGIIHRKALLDADLRKGTRETPIKYFQLGQSTMGKQSWSSPLPATRRRWREATVNGRPTPRGARLLTGAAQPLLRQAVAYGHAKAVGTGDAPRIASSIALSTV